MVIISVLSPIIEQIRLILYDIKINWVNICLYILPVVLSFKTNIKYILKQLTFSRHNKNIKLNISFYMKKRNIDCDNLLKVFFDAMNNNIVYVDDSQIMELHVYKIVGKK